MKDDVLIDVSQAIYSEYVNSVTSHPDFFEGRDVGRTHGMGAIYIGDRLVGEWSWVLNPLRQTRHWTYRLLKSIVEAKVNERP